MYISAVVWRVEACLAHFEGASDISLHACALMACQGPSFRNHVLCSGNLSRSFQQKHVIAMVSVWCRVHPCFENVKRQWVEITTQLQARVSHCHQSSAVPLSYFQLHMSRKRWAKTLPMHAKARLKSFSCDCRVSAFSAKGPRKRLLWHGLHESHRCGRERKAKGVGKDLCEYQEIEQLGSLFFFKADLSLQGFGPCRRRF